VKYSSIPAVAVVRGVEDDIGIGAGVGTATTVGDANDNDDVGAADGLGSIIDDSVGDDVCLGVGVGKTCRVGKGVCDVSGNLSVSVSSSS